MNILDVIMIYDSYSHIESKNSLSKKSLNPLIEPEDSGWKIEIRTEI
jgi:hypothetical protein